MASEAMSKERYGRSHHEEGHPLGAGCGSAYDENCEVCMGKDDA